MEKYAKINVFTKKVEDVSSILPPTPEANFWVKIPESAVNFEQISRGYIFDVDNDRFLPPKPFSSWILDEESLEYEAPIPKPTSGTPLYGSQWRWNHENGEWE